MAKTLTQILAPLIIVSQLSLPLYSAEQPAPCQPAQNKTSSKQELNGFEATVRVGQEIRNSAFAGMIIGGVKGIVTLAYNTITGKKIGKKVKPEKQECIEKSLRYLSLTEQSYQNDTELKQAKLAHDILTNPEEYSRNLSQEKRKFYQALEIDNPAALSKEKADKINRDYNNFFPWQFDARQMDQRERLLVSELEYQSKDFSKPSTLGPEQDWIRRERNSMRTMLNPPNEYRGKKY